jgi:hypothetical protein
VREREREREREKTREIKERLTLAGGSKGTLNGKHGNEQTAFPHKGHLFFFVLYTSNSFLYLFIEKKIVGICQYFN